MSTVQKHILRATLKAETVRIRHLKRQFLHHRTQARAALTPQLSLEHYDLMWRFRWSAECPAQRARCANLALGYLNGKTYRQIENKTRLPLGLLASKLSAEIATKANVKRELILAWMLAQNKTRTGEIIDAESAAPSVLLRQAS